MKVKGEALNVLRFEDEAYFDDVHYSVVHRAHIDETRWGQVYEAVVATPGATLEGKKFYRFTHEEPSTEHSDSSAYDFEDDEEIELERVVPTQKVITVYVKVA